jgi:hypothetical protein
MNGCNECIYGSMDWHHGCVHACADRRVGPALHSTWGCLGSRVLGVQVVRALGSRVEERAWERLRACVRACVRGVRGVSQAPGGRAWGARGSAEGTAPGRVGKGGACVHTLCASTLNHHGHACARACRGGQKACMLDHHGHTCVRACRVGGNPKCGEQFSGAAQRGGTLMKHGRAAASPAVVVLGRTGGYPPVVVCRLMHGAWTAFGWVSQFPATGIACTGNAGRVTRSKGSAYAYVRACVGVC